MNPSSQQDSDGGTLSAFSPQAMAAGLLAAFVGFASSFAVIIQGLTAMGASQAQAASGLMALSISMGLCAIYLSLRTRQPISIAWSTPGAALLAATALPEGGFPVAIGAFLISGALIVIAGLWKPLGRAVAAIPAPLANAMLAGVLLGLCLAPVKAIAEAPTYGLAIIVTWALVAKFRRLYAVPAAVLVTVIIIALTTDVSHLDAAALWPQPVLVMPEFTLSGLIGIALPLFIVTMASQNIPGIAVLNVNGYRPHPGPLFSITGIFTLLAAPFGGHAVNLAAITAALCAGVDAHPDPARRYWAAATSGIFYVLFGLGAGLALFGAFGGALLGAVTDPQDREAAIITFVVTASGIGFFGISGAFWGLLAGGAIYALTHWRRSMP